MAEIKQKFHEKLENFEPEKCNAYSISRTEYEAMMQRIIQMQDNTIKKEKRDYRIINRFFVNRFSRFSINLRFSIKFPGFPLIGFPPLP